MLYIKTFITHSMHKSRLKRGLIASCISAFIKAGRSAVMKMSCRGLKEFIVKMKTK